MIPINGQQYGMGRPNSMRHVSPAGLSPHGMGAVQRPEQQRIVPTANTAAPMSNPVAPTQQMPATMPTQQMPSANVYSPTQQVPSANAYAPTQQVSAPQATTIAPQAASTSMNQIPQQGTMQRAAPQALANALQPGITSQLASYGVS